MDVGPAHVVAPLSRPLPSRAMPSTATPITIVKVGGALLDDAATVDTLWAQIRALATKRRVVLVHGGGAQATALARRLGHEPRVVQGRRVTTDLDLETVQWTIRGSLNARLVAAARRQGVQAVGLSGADGGLVRVVRRPPWTIDGQEVDFGWVGDVEAVAPAVLVPLLRAGFVPVVAPLCADDEGQLYNVNADTVAARLAAAIGARELLLACSAGSLRRASDVVRRCDEALFEAGRHDGWITGGMRVKLQTAFDALRDGVDHAFIVGPGDLSTRRHATRVCLAAA